MARILLTGASGCVGSYALEQLSQHHEVLALTRHPERVRRRIAAGKVTLIEGDLEMLLREHRSLLATVEHCVHPATVWGGDDIFRVNVKQTLALCRALSPQRCRGIHYFSTASLLNAEHQVFTQTFTQGTDYIRSKACAHQAISQFSSVPVHIYYPTVIFGGSPEHGHTPVSEFLPQLKRHLRWVKWLQAEAYFHWIHARDIARILDFRIQKNAPAEAIVLGNPAYSVRQLQQELLAYYHQSPAPVQLKLERLLPVLLPLLAQRMSPWDRFSLHHRHLRYRTIHSQSYGLPAVATRIRDLL